MKVLIIYDSTFGNTERIARIIAHTLRVHDSVQVFSVEETNSIALKDADMLLIGCPTQRHGLTPAVRALLEGIPRGSLRGVSATAFDTRYHMSAWKSGSQDCQQPQEGRSFTHLATRELFCLKQRRSIGGWRTRACGALGWYSARKVRSEQSHTHSSYAALTARAHTALC
jgi:flavodoxin